MPDINPQNKVIIYLLLTAVMAVTFICAIAISHGYYSELAWLILLAINLGILVYLSTAAKKRD